MITQKAWFIRKTGNGYYAVARNLDTGLEAIVGPRGKTLPTIDATRRYINENWFNGEDFPGSIYPPQELSEADETIVTHCLSDIC